jgi:hypothetical protein
MLADIRPDSTIKQDFIDRNPVITNVQVVPDMSEHEVTALPGIKWIGSQTRVLGSPWEGAPRTMSAEL